MPQQNVLLQLLKNFRAVCDATVSPPHYAGTMKRLLVLLAACASIYLLLRCGHLDPTGAADDFEFHLSEDNATEVADEYTFDLCALGDGQARFRVLYEQSGHGGVIRQGILNRSEVEQFLARLSACGLLAIQSDGHPWTRPQTCIRYREGTHETYWHFSPSGPPEARVLRTVLDAMDATSSPDRIALREAFDRGTHTYARLRPRIIDDPPLPPFAIDSLASD